jgi:hypothetical protein
LVLRPSKGFFDVSYRGSFAPYYVGFPLIVGSEDEQGENNNGKNE